MRDEEQIMSKSKSKSKSDENLKTRRRAPRYTALNPKP